MQLGKRRKKDKENAYHVKSNVIMDEGQLLWVEGFRNGKHV